MERALTWAPLGAQYIAAGQKAFGRAIGRCAFRSGSSQWCC
jgi:hypothetical protein